MMSSNCTADRKSFGRDTDRFGFLRRFARDEDGVALIEFAMVLPMMLLTFAVIIEGSRLMLSYQSAINGVRDATRYLARTAPRDLCITGASLNSHTSRLEMLVTQGVSGASVFAPLVTIDSVTPSYRCVSGDYRGGDVPVAQVTATVTIVFPFAQVFTLFSGELLTVTTSVTDQSRVFGS